MKLAILGAPEAGKSKFAKALAINLKSSHRVKVVDNIVQGLEKKTGYAYGAFAAWPQQHQILFDRWTKEQIAEEAGVEIVISVGSIYEAILWTAICANQSIANDIGSQIMAKTSLSALGLWESLICMEFDLFFFLPYTQQKLADKGRSYETVINLKLPEVVESYSRKLILLNDTPKNNLNNARQAIDRAIISKQIPATPDEQSSIRRSGNASSDQSQTDQ